MAKLSARGRTELVRLAKEVIPSGPSDLCAWERLTLVVMSDRTVLKKRDVRFRPIGLDPEGKKHAYPWTVAGKLRADMTPEQFADLYTTRGYSKVVK